MAKNNNPRLLLAKVRKGDFAHAGDKEAIDLVLEKISTLTASKSSIEQKDSFLNKRALDVGCGLGGTASYIQDNTNMQVFGIDIDETSIKHAILHYPDVNFIKCDARQVDELLIDNKFDLIFLFNVLYAIPEKKECLIHLTKVANTNSILTIFDYVLIDDQAFGMNDLAGKPMHLSNIEEIKTWLNEAGWDLIAVQDLDKNYKKWYEDFLNNLKSSKEILLLEFTEETYNKVCEVFALLLDNISKKKIGGSSIYAKLRSSGQSFFEPLETSQNSPADNKIKLKP